MKDLNIRIINLDFMPGTQVSPKFSDREIEELARSQIEGLTLVKNREGEFVAMFVFRGELMATRAYLNASHSFLAAIDFVEQVQSYIINLS